MKNKIFIASCTIDGKSYHGKGRAKKQAKKGMQNTFEDLAVPEAPNFAGSVSRIHYRGQTNCHIA